MNQVQNSLFENPIFQPNADLKFARRNSSQQKGAFSTNEILSKEKTNNFSGDPNMGNFTRERKFAHNSEVIQSKPTYSNQDFHNIENFASNQDQFDAFAKYPSQRRKHDETKVLRSRNSLHNIKKRRYKSNENLLDSCELDNTNIDRRRGSSLANLVDKDRSRPPSVSSNYSLNHDNAAGLKGVHFDRNHRKSAKSCDRKLEFADKHCSNAYQHHHHKHFGLHYSQDEIENGYPNGYKSGRFLEILYKSLNNHILLTLYFNL